MHIEIYFKELTLLWNFASLKFAGQASRVESQERIEVVSNPREVWRQNHFFLWGTSVWFF